MELRLASLDCGGVHVCACVCVRVCACVCVRVCVRVRVVGREKRPVARFF